MKILEVFERSCFSCDKKLQTKNIDITNKEQIKKFRFEHPLCRECKEILDYEIKKHGVKKQFE